MSKDDSLAPETTLEERSELRRQRMEANRTSSFAEAEDWDLEFWQRRSPAERLSALVSLRRDLELVQAARKNAGHEAP